MSEKKVEINFPLAQQPIRVSSGYKYGLYRGDEQYVYLFTPRDDDRKVGRSSMVSGKDKDSRGPEGMPYMITILDDLSVKVEVYNSTNPVNVGNQSKTHGKILIDDFGSETQIRIGQFKFSVKQPEKESDEEDSESSPIDVEVRISDSREEESESTNSRKVKDVMVNRVASSLDRVHRSYQLSTVEDFRNQLAEDGLLENSESNILWIENGNKYTVEDINKCIKRLNELKSKQRIKTGIAYKVSTLEYWEDGLNRRITSEGQLRKDFGDLFLWSRSNNVRVGERAGQSRLERIDDIVN